MVRVTAPGLLAALALTWGGCAAVPEKPSELGEQRAWLLRKAEEKLRHALRISLKYSNQPFNQARQQLIYVLVRQKKYEEAVEAAEAFLEQKRSYLEERRQILLAMEMSWEKKKAGEPGIEGTQAEKAYQESREEVEAQVERALGSIQTMLLLLGDIYLRQGRKPEAVARYKEVLALRPDHAEALARVGQAHIRMENWTLAAGYLDRAAVRFDRVAEKTEDEMTALSPEDEDESKLLSRLGRRLRALEAMREDVLATEALCHFLAAEYESFELVFRRLLERNPDSPYLPLKIGLALARDGHRVEGEREIRRFLAAPSRVPRTVRDLARRAWESRPAPPESPR